MCMFGQFSTKPFCWSSLEGSYIHLRETTVKEQSHETIASKYLFAQRDDHGTWPRRNVYYPKVLYKSEMEPSSNRNPGFCVWKQPELQSIVWNRLTGIWFHVFTLSAVEADLYCDWCPGSRECLWKPKFFLDDMVLVTGMHWTVVLSTWFFSAQTFYEWQITKQSEFQEAPASVPTSEFNTSSPPSCSVSLEKWLAQGESRG